LRFIWSRHGTPEALVERTGNDNIADVTGFGYEQRERGKNSNNGNESNEMYLESAKDTKKMQEEVRA